MAKQLLIYENAVPITVDAHKDVSVKAGGNFEFVRNVNSVPSVAAEFAVASNDLAIVFAGTEDAVFPSVLLGLESDTCAFVDAQGAWSGEYVPAFMRRYPFVFAQSGANDDFTLCIDESFDGLNSDGVGERLFDAEGNRTQYMNGILEFSAQYQNQYARTKLFCDRLLSLGLLEPAVASYMGDDGQAKRLSGFFRISREKLKELSTDDLRDMFDKDELELCFVHLRSLGNISKIGIQSGAVSAEGETLQ
jgi:hypothetical protein